jgi:uncharacterized membrane protein YraQ (UPF0718 family)
MILAFSPFGPFERLADASVQFLGLPLDSPLGSALSFFIYEIVKVSLLIFVISWLMALVRRALPVEAMRVWLKTPAGRILGYPGAAAFGALTPFCSCSSVPLFIGFIEARLPVGIALAFLITSPLVNEIVVALFIASFGWKVTIIYIVAGVSLGIVGGWVLQRLHAERWLTSFAQRRPAADAETSCCNSAVKAPPADSSDASCGCDCSSPEGAEDNPPPESATTFANREAREIYFGVLPYLAIALVIGAAIHGFVPEQALAAWFATGRWWDVPAAVVLGFPLYASANATVPVLETLVAKGVPLGTGMAFIMAAVGVSLPELIILKRVMTARLLLAFSLTVSVGVVLVGLLFNFLF